MTDKNRSIINIGNMGYMSRVFEKIEKENKLNIIYLGGSITMGCNATKEELRYANRSAKWWTNNFPDAEVEFFNAGIGATTSQFGCARADDHVLSRDPDLVFVEFSVNDDNTPLFQETYESLIRKLLKHESVKAVVLINNLFYDTGANAQGIHNNIGLLYDLPIVSVRNYIYPEIQLGNVHLSDYTADMLHPSDLGHKMIADLIMNLLDAEYTYYKKLGVSDKPKLPNAFTACRYQDAQRFQNYNCTPVMEGFTADTHKADQWSNPFKDGWTAHDKGSKIVFKVTGGIIMLQWKRTTNQPAPIAYAIIDGDEQNKVLLDANFEETWGDLCALTTIYESENKGEHTVDIIVDKEGKTDSDFMVISVIGANK